MSPSLAYRLRARPYGTWPALPRPENPTRPPGSGSSGVGCEGNVGEEGMLSSPADAGGQAVPGAMPGGHELGKPVEPDW